MNTPEMIEELRHSQDPYVMAVVAYYDGLRRRADMATACFMRNRRTPRDIERSLKHFNVCAGLIDGMRPVVREMYRVYGEVNREA